MDPRTCVQRERERRYVIGDLVAGEWVLTDDPEKALLFSESPDEHIVWTRESLTTSRGPRG